MPVRDEDLETLEAYLDRELPGGDEGKLLRRLAAEPELAAVMKALRAERVLRTGIWASNEPDDAGVERLMAGVGRVVARHAWWAGMNRRLRVVSAAAACIVVGFGVGWLGRGQRSASGVNPGSGRIADVRPANANGSALTGGGQTGGPTIAEGTLVDFPVVDEYGQKVAVSREPLARPAGDGREQSGGPVPVGQMVSHEGRF